MRKMVTFLMALVILLTGCSQQKNSIVKDDENNQQTKTESKNILVAYFTCPETDGIDTSASASRIQLNSEIIGSTQYIAHIIQENTNSELFVIETIENYPIDHNSLVSQASQEKAEKLRPELKNRLSQLENYDTIFIGYPNWWEDIPMAVYTFLEEYDFTGKKIIPFNTHGGSGFSNTIEMIQSLQPQATVIKEGFTISRNEVTDSKDQVTKWLKDLGYIE